MGHRASACVDERTDPHRPIEPVESAVAAFIGRTAKGPLEPTRIRSWSDFTARFGAGVARGMVADAVAGFFDNGGTNAYVVRIGADVADDCPLPLGEYDDASDRLAAVEDVTIVCGPDIWTDIERGGDRARATQAQRILIAHCEQRGDRIAVLDAPPGLDADQALAWRTADGDHDSSFAVLYYPWLKLFDGVAGTAKLVPPCGHVAGVWARTDATRGVHKAATNELVHGVIGVGCAVSRAEQELLEAAGLNCVRAFLGRGVRVWGSKTLSSDRQWQEINVRRVVSHIEASVRRGTRWMSGEVDDVRLRRHLVRSVRTFLFQALLSGALVGESVADAFRVELSEDVADELVCQIGIAARAPGEFTTFRLVRTAERSAEVAE